MEDVIHVDEKLFDMTTVNRRYVLLPDEAVSTRRVRSKCHIPKAVVLAAVAMPHSDPRAGWTDAVQRFVAHGPQVGWDWNVE
ncbi:hypothetical protein PF006_g9605 [Phytophthora fragariae]|uniref:Uncharacterized protein n=1 Tax=Phytophthora fragariae TaxID=53985 RepID=A0A6A3U3E8_9STRA|nr:hypothetical protein PF006_g9605 [Phytophthora fragariae]